MQTRIIDNGEGIVVARQQEVSALIEHNAARRNNGDVGSSDMKLAAEIPMIAVEAYCSSAGITFQQFLDDSTHVKRMLSDPNLSKFRVWQGRA
jgi:hypothetical protein